MTASKEKYDESKPGPRLIVLMGLVTTGGNAGLLSIEALRTSPVSMVYAVALATAAVATLVALRRGRPSDTSPEAEMPRTGPVWHESTLFTDPLVAGTRGLLRVHPVLAVRPGPGRRAADDRPGRVVPGGLGDRDSRRGLRSDWRHRFEEAAERRRGESAPGPAGAEAGTARATRAVRPRRRSRSSPTE